ncbi:MAG: hypothetical protein H7Z12_20155 [Rhodospirillaceae bacterium]|nr:hypothetical protein [Rhodospirillales bacterium]
MWLRIYLARQAAARKLDLLAEAEAVFSQADAMGKTCPEAWSYFAAIILTRYARQFAAAGNWAQALAMAERGGGGILG